jgi:hypothetical protein
LFDLFSVGNVSGDIILADLITTLTYELPCGASFADDFTVYNDFEFLLTVTNITSTQISFKPHYTVNTYFTKGAGNGNLKCSLNPNTSLIMQAGSSTTFTMSNFSVNFNPHLLSSAVLRQYFVEIIRKIN